MGEGHREGLGTVESAAAALRSSAHFAARRALVAEPHASIRWGHRLVKLGSRNRQGGCRPLRIQGFDQACDVSWGSRVGLSGQMFARRKFQLIGNDYADRRSAADLQRW
jgi:hypothetical protein